jgi:hypothetical protein
MPSLALVSRHFLIFGGGLRFWRWLLLLGHHGRIDLAQVQGLSLPSEQIAATSEERTR